MDRGHSRFEDKPAVHTELRAIFVSMDLSRSRWVVTSLAPGCGDKMSRHSVRGGDLTGLLELLTGLQEKARVRTGRAFPLVTIQEAGMDGFWIHRALAQEGIESHVVDAASIATSRRRRNAKTDRLDGETLLRTLLAFKRGEPRVCAMVRPPTPEEEDRRRNSRERTALIGERVKLVNRDQGALVLAGHHGLRAPEEGSTSPARGSANRGRATTAASSEGCHRPGP